MRARCWPLAKAKVGDGVRVYGFGDVTVREPDWSSAGHDNRCTLTRGAIATSIEAYGRCAPWFAGDLNGGGIADVLLSRDDGMCQLEELYLSTPTGWTVAASGGVCPD